MPKNLTVFLTFTLNGVEHKPPAMLSPNPLSALLKLICFSIVSRTILGPCAAGGTIWSELVLAERGGGAIFSKKMHFF